MSITTSSWSIAYNANTETFTATISFNGSTVVSYSRGSFTVAAHPTKSDVIVLSIHNGLDSTTMLGWAKCTSPRADSRAALIAAINALVPTPAEQTVASSGTITSSAVSISRVVHAADISGVIIEAGTYEGQSLKVVNPANKITFAVEATSNVAGSATGKLFSIPAGKTVSFLWDNTSSLWRTEDKGKLILQFGQWYLANVTTSFQYMVLPTDVAATSNPFSYAEVPFTSMRIWGFMFTEDDAVGGPQYEVRFEKNGVTQSPHATVTVTTGKDATHYVFTADILYAQGDEFQVQAHRTSGTDSEELCIILWVEVLEE